MGFHLSGLSHLDPAQVPLPHGTEVVVRVDKWAGERRVPQGAVGRVVLTEPDRVVVHVVGVGEVAYARSEVVPRKEGQLRYAQRRALGWQALKPCVVLEAVVGSRAWGLADAGSDTDVRGVFALPLSWTVGLMDPPLDLVSADGSTMYWEVRKAVRQALRADPNTLEILFVDGVQARDELGEWLLRERDAFVSAQIYGSFGRYALSQLKKLSQSQRLYEHRAVILQWLAEDPAPSLDEVARRLQGLTRARVASDADAELQAKQYVKQLYRSMHDQGLLAAADFASLVRFAREEAVHFDLPRELRPKNAYNLLRLILTATHWLKTGEARLRVDPAWTPCLLSIKRGEVPLDQVLQQANELTKELEEARQHTVLPPQPDVARVDALLRRMGEEVARRWVYRVEGPLGTGAPPVPAVQWEEQDEGEA